MTFEISNKVSVITGAGSGIGLATAKHFISHGAKVVIIDIIDRSNIAKEIGAAAAFVTDISDRKKVSETFKKIADKFESIDILLASAGIVETASFDDDVENKSYHKQWSVNVIGTVNTIAECSKYMPKGSSIVTMSSKAADTVLSHYGAYSASKAAVSSITKTAAVELAGKGIRVNSISPASINTSQIDLNEKTRLEGKVVRLLSLCGRMGEPEEVANLFHFLASDASSYINGQIISIDGGLIEGIVSNKLLDLIEGINE